MDNDLSTFIDALHAIKFERYQFGSGLVGQLRADEVISLLVAGAMNISNGAPTVIAEIAKRILEAEANWNMGTGKSYCGQMPPL